MHMTQQGVKNVKKSFTIDWRHSEQRQKQKLRQPIISFRLWGFQHGKNGEKQNQIGKKTNQMANGKV